MTRRIQQYIYPCSNSVLLQLLPVVISPRAPAPAFCISRRQPVTKLILYRRETLRSVDVRLRYAGQPRANLS